MNNNNISTGFLSPDGVFYATSPLDMPQFCEDYVNFLISSNKKELTSFNNFKKNYQTFKPYFDYLLFEKKWLSIGLPYNRNLVASAKNDLILTANRNSLGNYSTYESIITHFENYPSSLGENLYRCDDKTISITPISKMYAFNYPYHEGFISPDGLVFIDLKYHLHTPLANTISNAYLYTNYELFKSIYENQDFDQYQNAILNFAISKLHMLLFSLDPYHYTDMCVGENLTEQQLKFCQIANIYPDDYSPHLSR